MSESDKIVEQILECDAWIKRTWRERRTARKTRVITAKNQEYEDGLRHEIHNVSSIEEHLFKKLWKTLSDLDDFDVEETEDLDGNPNYTYCDGDVHLVTDEEDNFRYGYVCDCEAVS